MTIVQDTDCAIIQAQNMQSSFIRREGTVTMPKELNSLERQDSCESVGSMCEEGIQVDADSESTEGNDSSSENNLELNPRSGRSSSVVSDASEEGGRDSGIEAEREPDMVIPDDELIEKIVTQVEFYFSDSNVSKDKFLLKHIRRNKEGYVSLKLVSSFKKIKQLTKDWRVVAHSLTKSSTKIQLNDQGSKIRRIDPLPEIDDTPVTCDVLAINLPLEKPDIVSVSQLFESCGDISLIRVVKAGTTLPNDIKHLAAKHPLIKDTQSAWIQFDSPEGAKKAVELTDDSMNIVLILPETQKKQEKAVSPKSSQPNSRKNSINNNNNNQQKGGNNSRKTSNGKLRKFSSSENDTPKRPQRRHAISMPSTNSPNLQELGYEARSNRRPKSKSCTEFSSTSPSGAGSWVQRHLFAAAAASAASAASPVVGSKPPNGRGAGGRFSHGSLPLPATVVRFPRGPDGSRGFNVDTRRRSVTISVSS